MLRTFFITLLCLSTIGFADAPDKPNIIFFIADDMLPKHFNCLPQGKGKNLTPNIDRLAAEGIVMDEQHCASPICTPSRYNVLTGHLCQPRHQRLVQRIDPSKRRSDRGGIQQPHH